LLSPLAGLPRCAIPVAKGPRLGPINREKSGILRGAERPRIALFKVLQTGLSRACKTIEKPHLFNILSTETLRWWRTSFRGRNMPISARLAQLIRHILEGLT
jgi:hypothetical protein